MTTKRPHTGEPRRRRSTATEIRAARTAAIRGEERRRAALTVCSMAADADEAAMVLDMLGLLDAEPTPVPAAAGDGRWNA